MAVSLKPKDAVSTGLGVQEGRYRITDAIFAVHQYQPNKETGNQQPPATFLKAVFLPLDNDGDPSGDALIDYVKVGALAKFLPSADGEEPAGDEVGDEGLMLVSVDGGDLNKKSKYVQLMDSIVKKGFKEDKITEKADCIVGLDAFFKQKKEQGGTEIGEYNVLVVDKIFKAPYEKGAVKDGPTFEEVEAGKGGEGEEEEESPKNKKKTGASTGSGKSGKSKPKDEDEEEENGDENENENSESEEVDDEVVEAAIAAAEETAGKQKARDVESLKLAAFRVKVGLTVVKVKPAKLQTKVAELIEGDDFFIENAKKIGIKVSKGMVTFV